LARSAGHRILRADRLGAVAVGLVHVRRWVEDALPAGWRQLDLPTPSRAAPVTSGVRG